VKVKYEGKRDRCCYYQKQRKKRSKLSKKKEREVNNGGVRQRSGVKNIRTWTYELTGECNYLSMSIHTLYLLSNIASNIKSRFCDVEYTLGTNLIKSCSSFENLSACEISWFRFVWYNVQIHLRSLKSPPSPYSRGPPQKMTEIKLVGMSMVVHFTKFLLSKCNGL
jgi:hypothetical protein